MSWRGRPSSNGPETEGRRLLSQANSLLVRTDPDQTPSAAFMAEIRQWRDAYQTWCGETLAHRRSDGETQEERAAAADARLRAELAGGPKVPARIDGRCAWCTDPMPVPDREQGGGRTKRFCTAACKQAHHRWTKDPERYPDAATWTRQRHTQRLGDSVSGRRM